MGLPANPFAADVIAPEEILAPVAEPDEMLAPVAEPDEIVFDSSLRPDSLEAFIGQPQLKANLRIFIDAARKRQEPVDHVLLHGNPGLGKTTLAHIIARETGATIRTTSGPTLTRVGDLAAILTNLHHGDILFIDEIHRMNKAIEEVLYPAMEDFALDLIVGKGPSARTIRLQLERITIIGATTRMSLLSSPLRDRFGIAHHLEFYEDDDIARVVERSATLLKIPIESDAARAIAARARKTPRIANRLLKRVRDFAQVKHDGRITSAIATEALNALAIDALGLDHIDRAILHAIVNTFTGGPVGLNTLSAALSEDAATIEEIYEPFLLQQGLINRTPRGRIATDRARDYMASARRSSSPL